MNALSNLINRLSPSATLAMSQRSAELKAQGVDVINLSVGEPDFNTPDHIKEAAKQAIDENFSRYSPVPGYPALRQAIVDKLKNDPMEGVDAILSVVPYYNKPTQQGMYAHFCAIAEATELPIILYNVPGRTGVNMLPETTLRIAADCANVVGIKEASGNVEQIKEILAQRPEGFKVFSGDDGITLPLIQAGADGVISVIGNGFAAEFAQMVRLAMTGEYEQAQAIDDRLHAMYSMLFLDGNPAGVKALLNLRGMVENVLRLPLVPATESTTEKIRGFLADYEA